ncbi:MAG: sulfatase-like hydrolase/transferase [Candidatus Lokiarchaeota archaeon]|nr:sulfatase-like hydrolase/transferase [Candidatus Lokiarchaeota archaeon]MBD3199811.1 sulfatase-like hydrolase/transferase [Candidatus Lokiarchaeota archaeon]
MVNAILIILDTLRQDHVGAYGNDWINTPNLDQFAQDSVKFTRMYPESLPTLPARKAIYTGRRVFPFTEDNTGKTKTPRGDFISDALGAPGWSTISDSHDTLAERFHRKRYVSSLFSDVYHQMKPGYNFQRGFDQWQWIRGQEEDAYLSGPEISDDVLDQYLTAKRNGVTAGTVFAQVMMRQFLKNTRWWRSEADTFPAKVFRAAGEWMDMNYDSLVKGKGFLTVESFDPHEPWNPPLHYIRMYEKDPKWEEGCRKITHSLYGPASMLSDQELKNIKTRYAAEVTLVDTWFGYFIDYIKRIGIWDDSIIVVVSDHGHMLGEHGLIAKAANPLGREVADLVAMIRFPGGEESGKTCDKFCYHHDIAATIGKACKISTNNMEGKDLLPLVKQENLNYYDHVSVAWGGSVAVYDGEYWYNGYVWDTEDASLFNVEKDPFLNKNIISEEPEKAKELLKLCWEDTSEPIDMDFMLQFKEVLGCTPVATKLKKKE